MSETRLGGTSAPKATGTDGSGTDPYTNPDELFDVCDASGQPTGRTKRRADVHRDGDWHRSFHCWVTSEGGPEPAVLLQRRGLHKDTWPGRLDVTVGGHYSAGEDLPDVLREVEEEIGRPVHLEELVRLGRRPSVSEQQVGIRDRELQDVYLWRSTAPLDSYKPQPVEVDSLLEAPLTSLLQLLAGQRSRVATRRLTPDGGISAVEITAQDFIPTLDQYFFRVAVAIDHALRGYPYLVV